MATPGKPGKAISSRLLTMKFMQRAAASPQSAPSTPDSRPAKRPRYSLPSRVEESSRNEDLAAVQAALAAEESRRQKVLDRQAHDAGDTKWTIEGGNDQGPAPLIIVRAGYGEIDSSANAHDEVEGGSTSKSSGRRTFGKFVVPVETPKRKRAASDSQDEEGEEHSGSDDAELNYDDTSNLISVSGSNSSGLRDKRKHRAEDERQDKSQRSARRQQEKVKLSAMTSISSGGGPKKQSPWGSDGKKAAAGCFTCGGLGHKKADCPRNSTRGGSDRRF